jgi:hypothetical protein
MLIRRDDEPQHMVCCRKCRIPLIEKDTLQNLAATIFVKECWSVSEEPPPAVYERRLSRIAKGLARDPLFNTCARKDSQRRRLFTSGI